MTKKGTWLLTVALVFMLLVSTGCTTGTSGVSAAVDAVTIVSPENATEAERLAANGQGQIQQNSPHTYCPRGKHGAALSFWCGIKHCGKQKETVTLIYRA